MLPKMLSLATSVNGLKHVMRDSLLTIMCLFVLAMSGCGYPAVSREAYQLAESLDQVFSAKDPQQLDKASELVRTWQQEGKITATEKDWFDKWLQQARGGDWEGAMRESRRLLKDQTNW